MNSNDTKKLSYILSTSTIHLILLVMMELQLSCNTPISTGFRAEGKITTSFFPDFVLPAILFISLKAEYLISFLLFFSGVSINVSLLTFYCRTAFLLYNCTATFNSIASTYTNSPGSVLSIYNFSTVSMFDTNLYSTTSIGLEASTLILDGAYIEGMRGGFFATDSTLILKNMEVVQLNGPLVTASGGTVTMESVNVDTRFTSTTPQPIIQVTSGECVVTNSTFISTTSNVTYRMTGMRFESATVQLTTVRISNMASSASNIGAALTIITSNSVNIDNCVISNNINSVDAFVGGTIWAMASGVNMYNCIVDRNGCDGSTGGGFLSISSTTNYINTSFTNNYATSGGALEIDGLSTGIFIGNATLFSLYSSYLPLIYLFLTTSSDLQGLYIYK